MSTAAWPSVGRCEVAFPHAVNVSLQLAFDSQAAADAGARVAEALFAEQFAPALARSLDPPAYALGSAPGADGVAASGENSTCPALYDPIGADAEESSAE